MPHNHLHNVDGLAAVTKDPRRLLAQPFCQAMVELHNKPYNILWDIQSVAMIIIRGKRTLRIKRYKDYSYACEGCHSCEIDVRVYREYYHLYFIPFFPIGHNIVKMRCTACGDPIRQSSVESHYDTLTKTPFYFYSGPILLVAFVLLIIYFNRLTQLEKVRFVATPRIGDVYTMAKRDNSATTYYFLRLERINGDTVFAYPGHLAYNHYPAKLDAEDYFVRDEEVAFNKSQLKSMLEDDAINAVDRSYNDADGFNRIR